MNVLVVGAGAVGQVYGRHMALGGADVSFFVKPRYEAEAKTGYHMYPLNRGQKTSAVRFEGFGVVTDYSAVGDTAWDQIWICTSSPALRAGWLPELVAQLGDALLVSMAPGPEDRDYLLAHGVQEDRLVQGLITLISYQAPLKGERREVPGVAYWMPPMAPNAFSGLRAQEAVDALSAGKCPAKVDEKAVASSRFASAILMPHLVALEAADWKLAGLRECGRLQLATDASREAVDIIAAHLGVPAPAARLVVRPAMMWLLVSAAPHVVPLPLEVYLEYHFTKVGDQTRAMMDTYKRLAATHGLPIARLTELTALLD
jgi:hypothetical protein